MTSPTRNTAIRLSLRSVTVLVIAATLSLLSSFPTSLACPLLLRGWSKNQTWHLAEKAERADIVALVRVVSSEQGRSKQYAAECLFLEVSKNLPTLIANSSFDLKHRVQVVFGFGPIKECRSEVTVGGTYLMMLTTRHGRIKLDYKAGLPAVIKFSPIEYDVVMNALGKWFSICSVLQGLFVRSV